MCGIFGFVTSNLEQQKDILKIIICGLEHLDYRGYDSAGIAIGSGENFFSKKLKGTVEQLKTSLNNLEISGKSGVGHTRWATHGVPSNINAHPHFSCDSSIAVVHNGIIENFNELKFELTKNGHRFVSQTDTEIIPHLVEQFLSEQTKALSLKSIIEAIKKSVKLLKGSFAFALAHNEFPEYIFAVRNSCPLIIGLGENFNIVASDIPALLNFTKNVIFINDGEIVLLSDKKVSINSFNGKSINRSSTIVNWSYEQATKGGFAHFMLKEIYEQPQVVKNTITPRVSEKNTLCINELSDLKNELSKIKRVEIVSCGTAFHAGLVAKYYFEEFARIPTSINPASEFRYASPIIDSETLVVAVSQSGETADTLASVKYAKQKKALVIGVCNVVGSSITRLCDAVLYTYAGPEIAVAATKTYLAQISALLLLSLYFASIRNRVSQKFIKDILKELKTIPDKIQKVLGQSQYIEQCSEKFKDVINYMYIGRKYNFPNAFEGALKLKEISYIHAEGYCGGEMKHGPLALVDSTFPTVAIAVRDSVYDKIISNIQEVKARNGVLISIATENDDKLNELSDFIIYVPETYEQLYPLLTAVPLQLIAYFSAVKRGCNVDKPRNLAKSVTVE